MKKYLALLAGLAFMASCESNVEPAVEPAGPVVPFVVAVETTTRTASATITPADAGTPYIAMFFSTAEMELFSEDDLAEDILAYAAANWGAKPSDLIQAGVETITQVGFVPETTYSVVVFGCDMDGTVTTAPVVAEFDTKDVDANPISCKFDISIVEGTLESSGAIISVKPSNKDVMYCVIPGHKSALDAYDGDTYELAKATVQFVEEQGQIDFANIESSESLQKGDTKVNCIGNLIGDSDQIVLCFVVNNLGEILSSKEEIVAYDFKTPHPGMSEGDFKFTYDPAKITFNSIFDAQVVPSHPYENYYCGLLDSRWKQINYPKDIDYMYWYLNQTTPQQGGNFDVREPGFLEPDKDYDFFAYYVKAGMPTSKLFLERIHTPKFEYVSGGTASVEMEVVSIRDGVEVGGGSYAGYGFIDVLYRPTANTKEYFVATPSPEKWDYWMALKGDELAKAVILNPGSTDHRWNNDRNADYVVWFWLLHQETYFYAVALDTDGKFGEVTQLKKKIVIFSSPSLSSVMYDNSGVTEMMNNRLGTKSTIVSSSLKN